MSGITEVVENLFISGLESHAAILNKGIRAVINISSECPRQDLGSAITYEKISIPDLPTTSIHPYFDRLSDRIEQNLQDGIKTLVHCYVGRSRSASIILAYLMKYKQMSLREAFYFLRARRPIVGPNFGFIKQLIAYEKNLFGYTTVSFVDTSYESIPDIYLSTEEISSSRRPTNRFPLQRTNETLSSLSRPSRLLDYSPTPDSRLFSNNYRPSSSKMFMSSSFLHDLPDQRRYNSFDSIHEPFLETRLNALRRSKYSPPFYNRLYYP